MTFSTRKSSVVGFFFVLISGILLHFAYEWSGSNNFVGLFSAVNESTWEHMKLLFMPALVYSLAETFFCKKDCACLLPARVTGLLIGLLFIPIAFYSYSGIIGKSFSAVNILIFAISVFLTFYLSFRIAESVRQQTPGDSTESQQPEQCRYLSENAAYTILLVLFLLFLIFTYVPPQIGLFQNPLTGEYGIPSAQVSQE